MKSDIHKDCQIWDQWPLNSAFTGFSQPDQQIIARVMDAELRLQQHLITTKARTSVFSTFVAFGFDTIGSDLLVVLFESCKILPGFGELTLFHSLSDIPMYKGPLGVHEVKLMV